MDINYTYVYKLVDENSSDIFYIGKTNNPLKRFYSHRSTGKFKKRKFYLVIIDKFIDREDDAINKHIKEGCKLLNVRKNDYIIEEHFIGDEISFDPYFKLKKFFNV